MIAGGGGVGGQGDYHFMFLFFDFLKSLYGVVRCGKVVVYLTSLGRPTDIGFTVGQDLLSL